MKVFVVTSAEFGWDCIVGVFNPKHVTRKELEEKFPRKDKYFIFEKEVELDLSNWEN